MGTAIKHPVPDRVKPSFVIFDTQALWRSVVSVRVPGCQNYKWRLKQVWHRMLYSCTHMATVGFKGLIALFRNNLTYLLIYRSSLCLVDRASLSKWQRKHCRTYRCIRSWCVCGLQCWRRDRSKSWWLVEQLAGDRNTWLTAVHSPGNWTGIASSAEPLIYTFTHSQGGRHLVSSNHRSRHFIWTVRPVCTANCFNCAG